jgi:hypothetical protein
LEHQRRAASHSRHKVDEQQLLSRIAVVISV